jgi:hypothetical protein
MDELIKALKLIKETCANTDKCITCPLCSGSDDCLINENTPSDWNIQDEPIKKVLVGD